MDDPPIEHRLIIEIGRNGITPSDQDGWRALGKCIGSHEYLMTLEFNDVNSEAHEDLEALLAGVNQNRSVMDLNFLHCHDEWPLGILATFFQSNQNLSSLGVGHCGEFIINSLSAALRGCTSTSLQTIACWDFRMGDEVTAEFIQALDGLRQLEKLEFCEFNFGRRGCSAVAELLRSPACVLQAIRLDNTGIGDESLSALEPAVAASSTLTELFLQGMDFSTTAMQSFFDILRSPTCMLEILDLCGNRIGDDIIILFVDALATNCRLKHLWLDDEHTISDIGFAAVARALCNTSSISNVHSSNHMLRSLNVDRNLRGMPGDLQNYLRMNKNENKILVAREKILMHFFGGNYSMGPFHENNMPPKILPHLLCWIGRMTDKKSFATLFNFIRRLPPVWGDRRPVLRRSRRKRKVRN